MARHHIAFTLPVIPVQFEHWDTEEGRKRYGWLEAWIDDLTLRETRDYQSEYLERLIAPLVRQRAFIASLEAQMKRLHDEVFSKIRRRPPIRYV